MIFVLARGLDLRTPRPISYFIFQPECQRRLVYLFMGRWIGSLGLNVQVQTSIWGLGGYMCTCHFPVHSFLVWDGSRLVFKYV